MSLGLGSKTSQKKEFLKISPVQDSVTKTDLLDKARQCKGMLHSIQICINTSTSKRHEIPPSPVHSRYTHFSGLLETLRDFVKYWDQRF